MILTLVNDLLDLAKIEQFKFILNETYFDMSSLVRQTCRTIKPLADAKGVKLHAHFKVSFNYLNIEGKAGLTLLHQKSIVMDLKVGS